MPPSDYLWQHQYYWDLAGIGAGIGERGREGERERVREGEWKSGRVGETPSWRERERECHCQWHSQSLVREGERRGVCERRRESEAGREELKIIMQWKIMNRDIP